jgi:hypothetical protein
MTHAMFVLRDYVQFSVRGKNKTTTTDGRAIERAWIRSVKWPVVKASTSPLASCNHLRFLIISDTSCLRRLIGLFPLLRFLRTLLLHLLHAHVMVVVLDGLLAVAGELRLPLAIASLLFRQRLLLV